MRNQDQEQELIKHIVATPLPGVATLGDLGEKEERPSPPEAVALVEYLLEQIATHSPEYAAARRGRDLGEWVRVFDYLLRLDKVPADEAQAVIRWAHVVDQTQFWRPNLLSAKKVRKHFPRLRILAKRAGLIHELRDGAAWRSEYGEWAVRLAERMEITPGGPLDGPGLIASAKLEGVPTPSPVDAESIASWALTRI